MSIQLRSTDETGPTSDSDGFPKLVKLDVSVS